MQCQYLGNSRHKDWILRVGGKVIEGSLGPEYFLKCWLDVYCALN